MALYLCVDCGGTKTSAVITNAKGDIVGRALGGPSNVAYLGLQAFRQAVELAVSDALKTCASPPSIHPVPLPPSQELAFAAAWFGISGCDSPAVAQAVAALLSPLLGIPVGPRLLVGNDSILLAAPLFIYKDIKHAVGCIAGTGSICVSFASVEGRIQELGRVGGWGWVLGDEGGGFHVGREALRQVVLEHDRNTVHDPVPEPSILSKRLQEYFGCDDVMDLLTIVHLADPPRNGAFDLDRPNYYSMAREKRLSSLSPLVFKAAFEDKDALALNVLRTCAAMLVDEIALLLRVEGQTNAPAKTIVAADSVISFGGSLVGIESYRTIVLEALKERGHVFRYVEYVDDPAAIGAKGLSGSA